MPFVTIRILLDTENETSAALTKTIQDKIQEWVPFQQMADDTIKQLIDDSEDIGTLEKGRKDFNTMWLVGNKNGTVYTGLESLGLCSCRLQLQGQRLVAFASVGELRDFYKQRGIKECLELFEKMSGEDEAQIPDSWAMPHLSFEFVRTGDVVFCPAGMVVVEKAVETSITARRGDSGLRRLVTVCDYEWDWNWG